MKSYGDKVNTNFQGNKIYKNCKNKITKITKIANLKHFWKNANIGLKKNKMENVVNDDLNLRSSDDSYHESNDESNDESNNECNT